MRLSSVQPPILTANRRHFANQPTPFHSQPPPFHRHAIVPSGAALHVAAPQNPPRNAGDDDGAAWRVVQRNRGWARAVTWRWRAAHVNGRLELVLVLLLGHGGLCLERGEVLRVGLKWRWLAVNGVGWRVKWAAELNLACGERPHSSLTTRGGQVDSLGCFERLGCGLGVQRRYGCTAAKLLQACGHCRG